MGVVPVKGEHGRNRYPRDGFASTNVISYAAAVEVKL
jgi:hypothetical protein